jgi:hypothetical protein
MLRAAFAGKPPASEDPVDPAPRPSLAEMINRGWREHLRCDLALAGEGRLALRGGILPCVHSRSGHDM